MTKTKTKKKTLVLAIKSINVVLAKRAKKAK